MNSIEEDLNNGDLKKKEIMLMPILLENLLNCLLTVNSINCRHHYYQLPSLVPLKTLTKSDIVFISCKRMNKVFSRLDTGCTKALLDKVGGKKS